MQNFISLQRWKRYLFNLFLILGMIGFTSSMYAKSYNDITFGNVTSNDIGTTYESEVYFSSSSKGSEFTITITNIYKSGSTAYLEFTSTKNLNHIYGTSSAKNKDDEEQSYILLDSEKMELVSESNTRDYVFKMDNVSTSLADLEFTPHLIHGNNIIGGAVTTTGNDSDYSMELSVIDATGIVSSREFLAVDDDEIFEESKVVKGTTIVNLSAESTADDDATALYYQFNSTQTTDENSWVEVVLDYSDTSDVNLDSQGYLTYKSYNVEHIPGLSDGYSIDVVDEYWSDREIVFAYPFSTTGELSTELSESVNWSSGDGDNTSTSYGTWSDIADYEVTQLLSGTKKTIIKEWQPNTVFLENDWISGEYKASYKFWGYVTVPKTDTYYFGMRADDGNRGYIVIDGEEVEIAESFQLQGSTYSSSKNSFYLEKGKYYPIYLEYFNWGGSADYRVLYSTDSATSVESENTQVPADWLYPSNSTYPGETSGGKFYGTTQLQLPSDDGEYYVATKLESENKVQGKTVIEVELSGITGPFEVIDYDSLTVTKEILNKTVTNGEVVIGIDETFTVRYTLTPKDWDESKGSDGMSITNIRLADIYPTEAEITGNSGFSDISIDSSTGAISAQIADITYSLVNGNLVANPVTLDITVTIDTAGEYTFSNSGKSIASYTDVDEYTQNEKEFSLLNVVVGGDITNLSILEITDKGHSDLESVIPDTVSLTTISIKQYVSLRKQIEGLYDVVYFGTGDYIDTELGSGSGGDVGRHATSDIMNDITDLKANEIKNKFIANGYLVLFHDDIFDASNLNTHFSTYKTSGTSTVKTVESPNDALTAMYLYSDRRPTLEVSNTSDGATYSDGDSFSLTYTTDSGSYTTKLYVDTDYDNINENSEIEATSSTGTISYTIPHSLSGIRPWTLEITDTDTGQKNIKTGYFIVKDTTVVVDVLQVTVDTNYKGSLTNSSNMTQEYLSDEDKDYQINITVIDMDTFNNTAYQNINGSYDMILFGFQDVYGSKALSDDAKAALDEFIATDQSVMFTHDMLFQSSPTWSDYLSVFGQKTPEHNLGKGAPATTTNTQKVNEGIITMYPFDLSDNISIATTHNQYFTLDLEDEDIIPWYNLSGSDRDVYDSYNHYYIYSKGSLTYSGTGHSGGNFPDSEQQLFVNTMYRAFLGARNHNPIITIVSPELDTTINKDDSLENSELLNLQVKIEDLDVEDTELDAIIYVEGIEVYNGTVTSGDTLMPEDMDFTNVVFEGRDIDIKVVATDSSNATDEEEVAIAYNSKSAPVITAFTIKNNTLAELLDSLKDENGGTLFNSTDDYSNYDLLNGGVPYFKTGDELDISLTLTDDSFSVDEDGNIKLDENGFPVDINFDWTVFGIVGNPVVVYDTETGELKIDFTVTVIGTTESTQTALFSSEGIVDTYGNTTDTSDKVGALDNTPLSDASVELEEETAVKNEWYLGIKHADDYKLKITNASNNALAYIIIYDYDYSKSDKTSDTNDLNNALSGNTKWVAVRNAANELGSTLIEANDSTQDFSGNGFTVETGRNTNTAINLSSAGYVVVQDGQGNSNTININASSGRDTVYFNEISGSNNNYNGSGNNDTLLLGKTQSEYTITNYTNNNGIISANIKDNSTGKTLQVNNIESIQYGSDASITLPIDTTNNKYDGQYITRRVIAIDRAGNMLKSESGSTTVSSISDITVGTTAKLTHYVDTIAPMVKTFTISNTTQGTSSDLLAVNPDEFYGNPNDQVVIDLEFVDENLDLTDLTSITSLSVLANAGITLNSNLFDSTIAITENSGVYSINATVSTLSESYSGDELEIITTANIIDRAENALTDISRNIKVDNTPPLVTVFTITNTTQSGSTVNMLSENADSVAATNGDSLTISLTLKDANFKSTSVLSGASYTLSQLSTIYGVSLSSSLFDENITLTVVDNEDGTLTFTIVAIVATVGNTGDGSTNIFDSVALVDKFGNQAATSNAVTKDDADQTEIVPTLSLDNTAPIVTAFTITNNTLNNIKTALGVTTETSNILNGNELYAKANDSLTISLTIKDDNFISTGALTGASYTLLELYTNYGVNLSTTLFDSAITLTVVNNGNGTLTFTIDVTVASSGNGATSIFEETGLIDNLGNKASNSSAITKSDGNETIPTITVDNTAPAKGDASIDLATTTKNTRGEKSSVAWYVVKLSSDTSDFSYQLEIDESSSTDLTLANVLAYIVIVDHPVSGNQTIYITNGTTTSTNDLIADIHNGADDGQYDVELIVIDKAGNISGGITEAELIVADDKNRVFNNINPDDYTYHVFANRGTLNVDITTTNLAPDVDGKINVDFSVASYYYIIDTSQATPHRAIPDLGKLEIIVDEDEENPFYTSTDLTGTRVTTAEADKGTNEYYTKTFNIVFTDLDPDTATDMYDKILALDTSGSNPNSVTVKLKATGEITNEITTTVSQPDVSVSGESVVPVITELTITNKTVEAMYGSLVGLTDSTALSADFYSETYTNTGTSLESTLYTKENDTVELLVTYTDDSLSVTNNEILEQFDLSFVDSGVATISSKEIESGGSGTTRVTVKVIFEIDYSTVDGDISKQINFDIKDAYGNSQNLAFTFRIDNVAISDASILSFTKPDDTSITEKVVTFETDSTPVVTTTETARYVNRYNDGGNSTEESYDYTINLNTTNQNSITAYVLLMMASDNNLNLTKDSNNIYWGAIKGKAVDSNTELKFELPVEISSNSYDTRYLVKRVIALDKAGNIAAFDGSIGSLDNLPSMINTSETDTDLIHYVDTVKPVIGGAVVTKETNTNYDTYKSEDQLSITFSASDDNLSSDESNDYNITIADVKMDDLAYTYIKDNNGKPSVVTINKSNHEVSGLSNGDHTIEAEVKDLAGNKESAVLKTFSFSDAVIANVSLTLVGSPLEDPSTTVKSLKSTSRIITASYVSLGITVTDVSGNAVPIKQVTVNFNSGAETFEPQETDATGSASKTITTLSSGKKTISSIVITSDTGETTTISSSTEITINSTLDTLSDVVILKDSKVDTQIETVGKISVSYDSDKSKEETEKSGKDSKIYKVTFDFSGVKDYTDVYKIIVEDIKIKGASASNLPISTNGGSSYSDFSSGLELTNGSIELTTENIGELFDGYSAIIYVNVTNQKNFIGSRITFEVDVVDGIGNKSSDSGSTIKYDATFPKQDLILKGRQSGSKREKTSTIQVVGDGSGSKFDIQSVIEAGQE